VNTLLERIGEAPQAISSSRTPDHGTSYETDTRPSNTPKDSPPPPVYIIRDLAAEVESDLPNGHKTSHSEPQSSDILTERLLSHEEALSLTEMCVPMVRTHVCIILT
jgi:hypothetical protein